MATRQQLLDTALDHYADRQRLVLATEQAMASIWSEVDPARIADSWANLLPEAVAVVSGAQLAAARPAQSYVDEVLADEDASTAGVGEVNPVGFAGQASDARGLIGLLTNPVVVTLLSIQDGIDVARALGLGRQNLQMLSATQVADAGRLADQTGITARPAAHGYTRMAVGNSCARCLILAGTFYEWNRGFQRHPKCFPAGVVVSGPGAHAATRRWYEGELAVISTASGQQLPATGNHPVLTTRGWVPAHLVQVGDYVVRSTLAEGAVPLVVPDERQVPARIEDHWRAGGVGPLLQMPTTAEDFHGDGGHGHVDVVLADRLLWDWSQAASGEPTAHQSLGRRVGLSSSLLAYCSGGEFLVRPAAAPDRRMGRASLLRSLVRGHLTGAHLAGRGHVPDWYASGHQPAADDVAAYGVTDAERVLALATEVRLGDLVVWQAKVPPRWDAPAAPFSVESRLAYAEVGQDLLQRLAGQVSLDRVVDNRRVGWSGHVYNLSSSEGWYSANGLIVSNCDCVHVPAGSDKAKTLRSPQQIYDRMTRAERTRAGFTLADQRAISEGADLAQVVNAHRGMYVAGGRKLTSEGVTKRGLAGKFRVDPETGRLVRKTPRQRAEPRLSVDEIFREAGDDRDLAVALLGENAYLRIGTPAPRREALSLAEPGPGVPDGPLVPSQVTLRPELEAAKTTAQVSSVFRAEYRRITGRPILAEDADLFGSLATAKEHAEGLLRGLEAFPDANLRHVFMQDGKGEFAETIGQGVYFNTYWANPQARKRYLEAVERDVAARFHVPNSASPMAIAIHEFGHIIDHGMDQLAMRRAAKKIVQDFADETGYSIDVVIRSVSGYAAKNTNELIAEAFADALINGSAASPISRRIFAAMKAEYRTRGGRIVDATPDLSVPGSVGHLTAPQLRALAKERGITVPAGAKKADLVRLIDEAPTPTSAARFDETLGRAAKDEDALAAPPIRMTRVRESGGDAFADLMPDSAQRAAAFDSIEGYVDNPRLINQTLRAPGQDRFVTPEIFDEIMGEVANIDRAMDASRLTKPIVVYRGRRGDSVLGPRDTWGDDLTGREWTDPAPASASAMESVGEHFGRDGVVMRVVVPEGTGAVQLSAKNYEAEILLERGLRYRVVRDYGTVNGRRRLDVEVVRTAEPVDNAAKRTAESFDDRIGRAQSDRSAANLPPVRVKVDASSGSDTGRWKAIEAQGLTGSQSALLTAVTSRVRVSGVANQHLRFPDGRPRPDWEIRMREGYTPEIRVKLDAADAAQRAKDVAMAEREIRALDRAMEQSRLPSDAVLWRGTFRGDIAFPDDPRGFVWTDPAYVGTSAFRDTAADFAAQGGGTLLRILVPEGTSGIRISGGGEAEILLRRGLTFRVVGESSTKVSGQARRVLDVEVVPSGATAGQADNAAKRTAARARQADIDAAQTRATALADLDEKLAAGATPATLKAELDVLAQTKALAAADITALRRVVAAGDRAKIDAAVDRLTKKYKLTGVVRAGDVTTMRQGFDVVGGRTVADGAEVRVVRRGTEIVRDGERIVLSPPLVRELDATDLARIRQAAIDEKRASAGVLSDLLEYLDNGADTAVLKRRAAYHRNRLTDLDPAVAALLRAADTGDPAKIRRAVAAAAKKLEVTRVGGDFGAPMAFDRKVHQALPGERIDAGATVELVAPAWSMTYRGETIQLSKAVVQEVDLAELRQRAVAAVEELLDRTPKPTAAQLKKLGAVKVGTVSKTKTVAYDPKVHDAGSAKVTAGAKVRIVEPGYSVTVGRETVVVRKPVVEVVAAPAPKKTTAAAFNRKAAAAAKGDDAREAAGAHLFGHRDAATRMRFARDPGWSVAEEAERYQDLRRYQGAAYESVNDWLRGTLPDSFTPDQIAAARADALARMARLDSVFEASPLARNVEVWRGLETGRGIFGDRLNADLTGFAWQELAYSSTSARESLARSFAIPGGVLMRIVAPKGVGSVDMGDTEAEILLERGLRYRVVADHGIHYKRSRDQMQVFPYRLVDVEVIR